LPTGYTGNILPVGVDVGFPSGLQHRKSIYDHWKLSDDYQFFSADHHDLI